MDVLARIPELPPPRAAVPGGRRGNGVATGAESASAPTADRAATIRRHGGRRSRIPTASVVMLAVIAAAVWSAVAWRERGRSDAAGAAFRTAGQVGASSTERTR